MRFACEGEGAARVLSWLAQAGSPALGDLAHGGSLASEGEPLFAREGELRVSEAARRALAKGHPWLTRDRESEDEGRFAPGAIVELVSGGVSLGLARVEGSAQLVARMWQPRSPREIRTGSALAKPASIEERVARALARREKLRAEGITDALRLVHGEVDGLPGLFVDRFGPLLRVLVAGRAALPLWERAASALARSLAEDLGREPSVVLVLQLRPQPPGELACVRRAFGLPLPEPLVVHEGALSFRIESGVEEPARPRPGVGFFADQRANRARVGALVRPGGRYLNLFAHTGAFSAVLLAAGAGEVVSVDLSTPYLARLEENLRLSSLALERHRSVKRDARRYLAELPAEERFDGIVLDPPTAAAAGGEFWSARHSLEDCIAACLQRVRPGGFLLVTTNDRRSAGRLAARVEAAAKAAACRVALEPAGPAPDFPPLKRFPEGAAFEGVLAIRPG
jgi:23S rRNA (cytosine1962-C5)-methyltransferase